MYYATTVVISSSIRSSLRGLASMARQQIPGMRGAKRQLLRAIMAKLRSELESNMLIAPGVKALRDGVACGRIYRSDGAKMPLSDWIAHPLVILRRLWAARQACTAAASLSGRS